MKIEIRDPKTIAAIIDYLDLPISKKATEIIYYNSQNVFVVYGYYGEDDYQSIQIQFSLDIEMTYWGKFNATLFSHEMPTTHLVFTQDNFYVIGGYNKKGRLEYDPLYIPSLD